MSWVNDDLGWHLPLRGNINDENRLSFQLRKVVRFTSRQFSLERMETRLVGHCRKSTNTDGYVGWENFATWFCNTMESSYLSKLSGSYKPEGRQWAELCDPPHWVEHDISITRPRVTCMLKSKIWSLTALPRPPSPAFGTARCIVYIVLLIIRNGEVKAIFHNAAPFVIRCYKMRDCRACSIPYKSHDMSSESKSHQTTTVLRISHTAPWSTAVFFRPLPLIDEKV